MKRPIYLVVTPFFPSPDHWQGPFVLDQVKAIERDGRYRVVVFRPCGLRYKTPSYTYDGIEVHHVPSFFTPSYLFNGFGGRLNGKNLLKELNALNINIDNIAVVHVHTASFACYAAAIKKTNSKVKSVLQYHDPDPYQIRLGKWAQWKPNALYRTHKVISYFKYIDLHLCISKKVEYNLTHFPNPHPEECYDSYKRALRVLRDVPTPNNLKTYVLYNGVDTHQFYPIEGLKDPSIFKIGCVANFVDWKDQMTLIKAVELLVTDGKHENIRVSFVGSGVTKLDCQKYIDKHNLQKYFVFEKEVHHSELVNYYNTLDLFVLPSYFEGFGCVFTEAAACNVPFICCKKQGVAEYIPEEDASHWLVDSKSPEQIASCIEKYYKNRQPQRLMYSYNIDKLIEEFIKYIQQL